MKDKSVRTRSVLKGIIVADFSWLIIGPLTTRALAEYGATVIKVEGVDRPDELRSVPPYKNMQPGVNRSWVINNFNSGKLGMTVDLNNPKGLELAKEVVKRCDIMVENYRPGTTKRWGLDYESVKTMNPRIIMVSLTGQGQGGPLVQARFTGMHLQAYAGIAHFVGWPDRDPAAIPVPYADYILPWFAISAIMAALAYRRKTGRGQHLDLSMLESAAYLASPVLLDYSVNNRVQGRKGNRSDEMSPHGAFRCKGDDKWCVIAVRTDDEWQSLCRTMGRPDLVTEPRFSTILGRKRNEDELEKIIEAWTAENDAAEVMAKLQKAGIPAGVVQNMRDLCEGDPQIRHRRHLIPLSQSEIGEYNCQQLPFRMSKTRSKFERGAPIMGEHNYYIATKILGLSDDEFTQYYNSGAFGRI